ncbi:hypothetical protein [Streptosporangium sp. NPDC003464]
MPNDAIHGGSNQFAARLVATATAPLDLASADGPQVLHWPGRRLLVQRGDTELAVRNLDGDGMEVRFPALWPRRYGSVAVSPAGDLAVFAGVHALRAVDSTGAVRWEIRHGWDGARLTAQRFVEEFLLAVSPSGEYFLTTDLGQWSLYLHRAEDGMELRHLDAEEAVPPPANEDDRVRWDYEAAFPYEDTAVVGTEYHADDPRHWLVDPCTMALRGRIAYPSSVAGSPRSAGQAAWYTVAEDQTTLHLWSLPHRG